MTAQQQGYWRDADTGDDTGETDNGEAVTEQETAREDLSREEAEEAWVAAAHEILTDLAATYQAVIETSELGNEVKARTQIQTRAQTRSWMPRVLERVAELSQSKGEPALTSLVVNKTDGMVGTAYDTVLRLTGQEPIAEPLEREKHAAQARLECYRWGGAKLPAGGGMPALSPRLEQVRARERKERIAAIEPNVCASCFMVIPPTGVCDNCG